MSSRWKRGRFSRAAKWTAALLIVGTMGLPVVSAAGDVVFRGNREFSDEQMKSLVAAGSAEDLEGLAKRIQSAYIERGRLLAEVRVEKSGADSTVVLLIDEGSPTCYRKLTVTGARLVDGAKLRDALGVERGDRFIPRDLRAGFRRILEYYDANGHPFTQIWVDSLALDEASNTVDLSVIIVEGGRETISRVEFEGLEHTRESLAVKLSGLKPGELYDGERIRAAHLRLSTSGVFEQVSYPTVRLSSDGPGVETLIRVLETKGRNSLAAAIGYADRQGAEDRVLSGLLRLDLVNIGGSLRDLHVLWKNDGQGRSETRLSFRERFFLGRRVGLGLALEQVGLDTLYTWQSAGLESSVPVGRLWRGLLSVDAGVYGDRNTFSQGDVASTVRLRFAGGVNFVEGREDRGAFFELRTRHTYATKDISGRAGGTNRSLSQYIFESQLRATADLVANSHGAVELVYRGIESNEEFVPLSEQFYVGGAATIRGYRENQYHGRRVAYARSEFRIGKNRLENGYLFVDGGYVLQESTTPPGDVSQEEKFPVGYGFGLRTESRAGNIDISFGVGDEPSLRATKVHVILNRTF